MSKAIQIKYVKGWEIEREFQKGERQTDRGFSFHHYKHYNVRKQLEKKTVIYLYHWRYWSICITFLHVFNKNIFSDQMTEYTRCFALGQMFSSSMQAQFFMSVFLDLIFVSEQCQIQFPKTWERHEILVIGTYKLAQGTSVHFQEMGSRKLLSCCLY